MDQYPMLFYVSTPGSNACENGAGWDAYGLTAVIYYIGKCVPVLTSLSHHSIYTGTLVGVKNTAEF